MPFEFASFAFIITLAAVVNGLGIVRWLTGFTEYLRRRQSLQLTHYWIYTLSASFQFILHILLWWSLWSVRGATTINFLTYLYLLTGPVLLFVGTAVLMPDVDDGGVDLRKHYFSTHPTYSTVLVLLWLWAIFTSPILRGYFAPTLPMLIAFLANALVLRLTANPKAHSVSVILNWLLLVVFVALYSMQLGGTST